VVVNLGENARPFFVAMPKDRTTITNKDYWWQILIVDINILKQFCENVVGGFDKERFGNHVGFGKQRLFLEVKLIRWYKGMSDKNQCLSLGLR
jgi:hypothetical protein